MIEFDPNNPIKAKKVWEYATYIPDRAPNFKMHEKKNHATNAINNRANNYWGTGHPGILYQFVKGVWIEIDRYEPPTHCDHCGRSFTSVEDERRASGVRYSYSRAHILHDKNIKPQYKQKRVCNDCYDNHFNYKALDKISVEMCGLIERDSSVQGTY